MKQYATIRRAPPKLRQRQFGNSHLVMSRILDIWVELLLRCGVKGLAQRTRTQCHESEPSGKKKNLAAKHRSTFRRGREQAGKKKICGTAELRTQADGNRLFTRIRPRAAREGEGWRVKISRRADKCGHLRTFADNVWSLGLAIGLSGRKDAQKVLISSHARPRWACELPAGPPEVLKNAQFVSLLRRHLRPRIDLMRRMALPLGELPRSPGTATDALHSGQRTLRPPAWSGTLRPFLQA